MKLLLLTYFVFSFSLSYGQDEKPGCNDAREFLLLAKISQDIEAIKGLQYVRARACAGRFRKGETIRYANGNTATNWAGKIGQTWYYPNGRTITNWSGKIGQTWYYPNGRTATNWSGKIGQTWYYANGNTITNWSGKKGATLYQKDGHTCESYGPEFVTEENKLDTISFLRYIKSVCMYEDGE